MRTVDEIQNAGVAVLVRILLALTGACSADIGEAEPIESNTVEGEQAELTAARCTNGPTVTDYRGHTWSTVYCPTWIESEVLLNGEVTGQLYAGRNWFVCQKRFDLNNPDFGRGYLNNVWLYTQGDEAESHGGWGWVPATAVSLGDDWEGIPGVRWC